MIVNWQMTIQMCPIVKNGELAKQILFEVFICWWRYPVSTIPRITIIIKCLLPISFQFHSWCWYMIQGQHDLTRSAKMRCWTYYRLLTMLLYKWSLYLGTLYSVLIHHIFCCNIYTSLFIFIPFSLGWPLRMVRCLHLEKHGIFFLTLKVNCNLL